MQIQINTDHNIERHEALAAQVSDVVESALNLVSDHITRVEVHLSDENGDKHGPSDKRCMMKRAWRAANPSQSFTGSHLGSSRRRRRG